ncbi:ribosomal protein ala-acetyltransferase [Lactobacillus hamsteri DSM 5661 = JCM 6256]|uniref:Ribosomal protein ala-acetyltransferase n=2 Tax=Lactobacillus hamsteri TaxID=96565 RepID=A0A0R1YMG5_9LACO|nr:ribosomal protein ala-acetyltransferase [Lactobacillus hamsteri DSM 5661 = JCM 6256]
MTVNGKVLQVMQATDNDIPGLLILEKQVYSGQTPWSSFSFESELKKRKNSLYLVVYQASTLVAFIGARFYSRETHITNIAVAPQFQGQHIGKRLMELMIDRARENDNECVSLEVRIDNEIAKKLYRSLGFEEIFIRKNYYQDTHTDAINMILWLRKNQNKGKKFTL